MSGLFLCDFWTVMNMLWATTMLKLPREKSLDVCGWVSKLCRRFSRGNLKKKTCYNLVPFQSSTHATKPDSITNK